MNKELIKLALCHTIPAEKTSEPLWLPLIPAEGKFSGRDKRSWTVTNAQAIIDNTELPFQLDIDHNSEITLDTSASGWFVELKVKDGQIMGKLELNSKGRAAIDDKQYKFYSPAFDVMDGEVVAIASVGLTNRPNLDVPALNGQGSEETKSLTTEVNTMEKILLALGLAATADEQTALNAVEQLKAKQPDLNAFVPKATHDQVVTELNTVKQQLADKEKADHDAAVEVALNAAIKDKKIAPADKEFYLSCCASEKGLEDFRQFVANKAAVIGDVALGDNPPAGGETALNSEQKGLLSQLGLSEADFIQQSKLGAGINDKTETA